MVSSSRSRILLLLGLLAVLIVGAWRVFGSGKMDSPEAIDAPAGQSASTSAALVPASQEVAAAGGAPHTGRRATDGLLVRVIDGESGAPVAGAEVMWLLPEQWIHRRSSYGLHFSQARQSAPRIPTEEDGFAVLPHINGPFWLAACTAEASQSVWFFPGAQPPPLTIQLLSEVQQAVRVEDLNGRPVAGATVGLLIGEVLLAQATTDADGTALLRDLQTVRSTSARPREYAIGLTGPFSSEQRIPYQFDAPPAEPPVLRMEPWGEVEILMQDQDGMPLPGTLPVQLRLDDPTLGRSKVEDVANASTLTAPNGQVIFSHVPLNRSWQAAHPRAQFRDPLITRFAGPRVAGERVTAILQFSEENPWITLRVTTPDGEAAPGLRVIAQYTIDRGAGGGRSGSGESSSTLDADSRLEFEAWNEGPDSKRHAPAQRLVELTAVDPRSGAAWSAELPVPAMLDAGRHDLGEVRMLPTPVLVEGRLLTRSGQPVKERIMVSIHARNSQGEWLPTPIHARSDEEGRFRMEGRLPPGEFRVTAWLRNGSRSDVPFELGATGVELVFDSIETLKGKVLLDAEVPQRSLLLVLRPEALQRAAMIEENGAWTMDAPPDGVYSLFVMEARSHRVLWTVDKLTFKAGMPTDRKVLHLDLRGKFKPISIHVTDSDGQPIDEWEILFPEVEIQVWHGMKGATPAVVLIVDKPLDFSLRAAGYLNLAVHGVRTDQRIVLQQGIAVRVAIVAPSPLPTELEFVVLLYDETGNQRGAAYLDAAGTGIVWLPQADTYHLDVSARVRQSDRSARYDVRLDAETDARRKVVVPAEGIAGILQIGLVPASVEEVRKRHAE
jgi:hypothetical protein